MSKEDLKTPDILSYTKFNEIYSILNNIRDVRNVLANDFGFPMREVLCISEGDKPHQTLEKIYDAQRALTDLMEFIENKNEELSKLHCDVARTVEDIRNKQKL